MIIHAHTIHPNYVSSVLVQPWFAVLVIALAVERLSGLALGVAMERDWIVLLAGTNRPIALAKANAFLSRIDLLCEVIFMCDCFIKPILQFLNYARFDRASLYVIKVVLTWLTNTLSAGVLSHAKYPQTDFGCLSTGSIHDAENIFTASIEATKHGWFEYIKQPVLPASLAYVLLYFNVALAPGGLMTAFLTQHGNFWFLPLSLWIMAAIISSSLCCYTSIRDVRVNGAARSAYASPKFGTTFATGSPLLTVRCEQSTKKGSGLDVWLGRLAIVGFAAAISVEIATSKGLLEAGCIYIGRVRGATRIRIGICMGFTGPHSYKLLCYSGCIRSQVFFILSY
ncbi:hypothetical protein ACS0TY_013188 [Phlomoides rotata]